MDFELDSPGGDAVGVSQQVHIQRNAYIEIFILDVKSWLGMLAGDWSKKNEI